MKKVLWIIVLISFCTISLAENSIRRKIIVGGDSDYPPFEFINSAGAPDGYNVELSQLIAKEMDVDLEIHLGKWALVRNWLENGSINVIQGMAFSTERAREYYFSSPHMLTWRAIFTRKDSQISKESDILDLSIAIQQDDVAEEYLKSIGHRGQINPMPSPEIAIKLLSAGDFDAVVANYMTAMYIIQNQGIDNIRALPIRIQQRDYCYASLDQDLITEINQALASLDARGELTQLHVKWFEDYDTFGHSKARIGHSSAFWLALIIIIILIVAWVISVHLRKKIKSLKLQLQREEKQLQLEKSDLDLYVKNIEQGPVIVYKMSLDPLQIHYVSENVFTLWGYTPKELIDNEIDFTEFIFPEDKATVIEQTKDLTPGQQAQFFYRVTTKNGELRWVIDYSTIDNDPQTEQLCFWGYLIDVTDQKKYEAQLVEAKEDAEAANNAKSHFLANMSHEIRTPLNGINGFLQVLMQMDATPQQIEIYDIMYNSCKNLLKIINDILDFSKIESGKLELIETDFNLKYMIHDIVSEFSHQTKNKSGLVISSYVHPEIPDVLFGDQLRIRQILVNLMHNAVKFTEKGKIEIIAEPYTSTEHNIRILFKVQDTGVGIEPTKQKDIFDNYTQADSQIASKYGGTGLGLAIVKKLVELMHGFIWVESEPGKGSVFFFIIPFSIYDSMPEIQSKSPQPEILIGDKIKGRILLVEDDYINQLFTKRQLENWGLTVEIANNGLQAYNFYKQRNYDLILMDIQMPVMDGITSTQKIRDIQIQTGRNTPIIAYTADALAGDRERFLASGMDDYLAKPVEIDELYQLISKYINASKA